MNVYKKTFKTPICEMTVLSTDNYIINLCFKKDNYDEWLNKYVKNYSINSENKICRACESEICDYFNGKLFTFTVPTKLYGTEYQKKVWLALINIPYGKTVSYGELTKMIGEESPRTAGTALSKNPISIIYPCHRVVKANGSLGGFGGGYEMSEIKQQLLKIEGLVVNP